MPRIQTLDERKYPMPLKDQKKDAALPYYRWEHRATLSRSGRTFLVFVDNGVILNDHYLSEPSAYIEEVTTGNLKRIKEDKLVKELQRYAQKLGYMDVQIPIQKVKS